MGLDQYIYRIEPITKEQAVIFSGKKLEEIPESLSWFADDGDGTDDLKTVGHPVVCKRKFFDEEKMRKDHGIDSDMVKWHSTKHNLDNSVTLEYSFQDDRENVEITLTPSDIDKYSYYEDYNVIITGQVDNVFYWRKRWDVQNAIDEVFEESDAYIENCGFYRLDNECLEAIGEKDPVFEDEVVSRECVDKENLFYHPWW